MYIKPSAKGIANAIACGIDKKVAERGYDVFDYGGNGILEVEHLEECWVEDEPAVDDRDCAIEAGMSGTYPIIPINQLPEELPDELKYYGWVDTPENRRNLNIYAGLPAFTGAQQVVNEACELLKRGYGYDHPLLRLILSKYEALLRRPDWYINLDELVDELDEELDVHNLPDDLCSFYAVLREQILRQKADNGTEAV